MCSILLNITLVQRNFKLLYFAGEWPVLTEICRQRYLHVSASCSALRQNKLSNIMCVLFQIASSYHWYMWNAFYLGCFESVISGPYSYHFVAGVPSPHPAPHKVTEKKNRILVFLKKVQTTSVYCIAQFSFRFSLYCCRCKGLFYNQGTSSVSFLVKNEMFCNSTTCFILCYE